MAPIFSKIALNVTETGSNTNVSGVLATDGFLDLLSDSNTNSFDFRQSFTLAADLQVNDSGFSSPLQFTSALGTLEDQFIIAGETNGELLRFDMDGAYAFTSEQLPDNCNSGAVVFETLQTLELIGEQFTAGRLRVSSDGQNAEVQFNSDGSSDVLVDGQSLAFSAQEIDELTSDCALGSQFMGLTLDFTTGFLIGAGQ